MSDPLTKTIAVPKGNLFREVARDGDEGTGDDMRMSISSDQPYKRYDWMNDEEYWEVLDHGPGGMDDTRLKAGLPVLFNHDRDQHLGLAKSFSNDGKKCVVSSINWSGSEFAQQKKRDAISGALPHTSVGYQLSDDGECIGKRDGIPIYKFKWAPFEASLVTVPADHTVGVGRSDSREIRVRMQNDVDDGDKMSQQSNQEPDMKITDSARTHFLNKDTGGGEGGAGTTAAEVKTPPVNADDVRKAALKDHRERCKKINDFVSGITNSAWRSKATEIAAKHLDTDLPEFDAFRSEALNAFESAVGQSEAGSPSGIVVVGERGQGGNPAAVALGIGTQFVKSKGFKEAAENILNRRSSNEKFAADLPLGPLSARMGGPAMQRAGFTSTDMAAVNATLVQTPIILGVQKLSILDLISPGTMDHQSVIYPIEASFNPNNGANGGLGLPQSGVAQSVPERGLKPSWDPVLGVGRADAQVIAVMATVPIQFMQDFSAFGSYINQRGPYLVDIETERQILYGSGQNGELQGITSTPGILRRAVQNNTPASGNETCYDSLYKALTDIRVASYFEPDGYAIHPYDWEVIRLMKDANGQPIATGPFYAPYGNGMVVEMELLWGKPVAKTVSVLQGRPIAGAWKLGAQYFMRMGMQIEMSNSHLDYFDRNLLRLRFEHRLALAVYRPVCFEELTGFPART